MKRAKLYSVIAAVLLGLAVIPQMAAANTEPMRASEYISFYNAYVQPLNNGRSALISKLLAFL